ncbi:MAG: DUF2207 domain-containing protein [Anaerovoracaceae bacterium]
MKNINNKFKIRLIMITFITIVLSFGLATSMVFAATYSTDKFMVNVQAQEDNSFLFTETISVDFYEEQHGIYRNIPEDMGKMTIEDAYVEGYNYETFTEDGNYVIRIGREDETVTGRQTYVIHYTMRVYDDKDTRGDYIYLDLLPTSWETPITHGKATLTMPKSFDETEMKVYSSGYGGDSKLGDVKYSIDENSKKITVIADNTPQGQGVSVQSDLVEGYWINPLNFDGAKKPIPFILIIVPLILMGLWFAFGRDPKVVQTVEFYPPDGMTPAEIGYIVDGMVDNADMTSLIMYLAYKKYITITEYKKEKFQLKKIADIDSKEKAFVKTFYDGLFQQGDTIKLDDLDESFGETYLTSMAQLKAHYSAKKENRLFTVSSQGARIFGGLLMVVPLVATIILSVIYSMNFILLVLAVPVFLVFILGLVLFMIAYDKRNSMKTSTRNGMMISGTIIIGITVIGSAIATLIFTDSILLALLLVISSAVSYGFVVLMKARTKKSAEWVGKILGLKDFIKAGELDRLKALVEEDPEYFYDVLPYAYVLGLSDKWAKNFENIPTTPPSWYAGSDNTYFNVWMFSRMMNNCTGSVSHNLHFDTTDSGMSGGGFGGGGFTGGGFGGGGGGAW